MTLNNIKTDCLHGSQLDINKCACTSCPFPFGGGLCHSCKRRPGDCKHGGILDVRTCKCTGCDGVWGGDSCTECLLPESHCGKGGKLNKESCSCECAPGNEPKKSVEEADGDDYVAWSDALSQDDDKNDGDNTGTSMEEKNKWLSWADAFNFLQISTVEKTASSHYCGTCPMASEDCKRGSNFVADNCMCTSCRAGYGGLDCGTCKLEQKDCLHGSILDPKTCKCSIDCPANRKGLLCDRCALKRRDCEHKGKLNKRLCRCEKCESPFGGDLCNECQLDKDDCKHGGKVCKSRCKCFGCDKPWKGDKCNTCGLTDQDCANGGMVDTSNGQCTCKCTERWSGSRCEKCALDASVCGEGTVLDKIACACKGNAAGMAQSARKKVAEATTEVAKALQNSRIERDLAKEAMEGTTDPTTRKVLQGKLQAKTREQKELVNIISKTTEVDDDLAQKMMGSDTALIELNLRSLSATKAKWKNAVKIHDLQKNVPAARQPEGEVVRCKWEGQPDLLSQYVGGKEYYGRKRTPNFFQHLFVDAECYPRLPDPRKGDWLSSIRSTYHCGISQQWSILSPNEVDGPGIMWYNDAPCTGDNMGLASIEVDFFLPKKENAKHLHLCRFQGKPERVIKPLPCENKTALNSGVGCRRKKSYYEELLDRIPGRIDATTGGLTKKFEEEGDARFWADKVDRKDFDSRDVHKFMPPGFYRHEFSAEECTNGLPPTTGERQCLVSFRWGEHCGGDWDWAAIQGKTNKQDGRPAVSWYTSLECDTARVAVDYYCPPKTSMLNTFQRRLHTCKFKGEGKPSKDCPAESRRHANTGAEGKCVEHRYDENECSNGLPGVDKQKGEDRPCLAAINSVVQCGHDQDFSLSVTKKGAAAKWYQQGWSLHRDGNGKACSKAVVDSQFLCVNECTRRCHKRAKYDKGACKCKCPFPYTGVECRLCGLEESDCQHGFKLDFEKCRCMPFKGNVQWGDILGSKCILKQSQCKNGGRVDRKSCTCVDCMENWGGKFCHECTRNEKTCKRGSKLDVETCKCSINCPKPFWGETCERCPRSKPPASMKNILGDKLAECSGIGVCKDLKCECPEGFSGNACQNKDTMAVCSISNMGGVSTIGGTPLRFSKTGEYILFRSAASKDPSVTETVHALRVDVEGSSGGTSGFSGIAIKTPLTIDGKSVVEDIVILGRRNIDDMTDLKPRIFVNCEEKRVASTLETKSGATVDNSGTSYNIVTAMGTQVRVMVFVIGKQQFLNGIILSSRKERPLEKGVFGACGASKTSSVKLKKYALNDRRQSLFSCPNIRSASEQRQPRFRALVAQTTKLQSGASSGILVDEMLTEKAAKAVINGLGRFAVLQTPTKCHRPESKVRECCSRVGDGQEWKSEGSKPGNLEKEAFTACARSFCRKTTCPMAITMGRMPVSLKAEAQDEIVEEKRSMLSEIKRFSRETVSKKILDERQMDNPNGC